MDNISPIPEKLIKKMIKVAKETRKNAFAYRSMHKIWASVLMWDGTIIWWCNVEWVISWLWICAERCAIDNSISNWEYDIVAVCTVDTKFTPTCGACLQYIMLFSQILDRDIWIINWDIRWHYKIQPLSELLPDWYKTKTNLQLMKKYIKQQIAKKNKK